MTSTNSLSYFETSAYLQFIMNSKIILLGIFVGCCALLQSVEAQESTSTPAPTPSDWYECPEINGYFPHPYDCEKYFVCVNNNAWMLKCPAKLWYDSERKFCDFPENVACAATPTGGMKV